MYFVISQSRLRPSWLDLKQPASDCVELMMETLDSMTTLGRFKRNRVAHRTIMMWARHDPCYRPTDGRSKGVLGELARRRTGIREKRKEKSGEWKVERKGWPRHALQRTKSGWMFVGNFMQDGRRSSKIFKDFWSRTKDMANHPNRLQFDICTLYIAPASWPWW